MTRNFAHHMSIGPGPDGQGPAGRGPAGRGPRRRGRGGPWGGGRRGPRGPWAEGEDPRSEWGWDEETSGRGGGPGWGGGRGRSAGPVWGPGPARPGRGRGRRGDVRQAVLRVVAEQPSTGYQIMTAIATKSQELWKPGPGSVYPALQSMTDEGLVTCQESEDGKKVYTITEDGRERLAEGPEKAPWERMAHDMAGALALRPAMESLRGAVAQVARSGTDAQRTQARELLDATRRKIYLILASDDEEPSSEASRDGASSSEASAEPGDDAPATEEN